VKWYIAVKGASLEEANATIIKIKIGS